MGIFYHQLDVIEMSRSSTNKDKKKPPRHSGRGEVRIISGRWRGRKLAVPDVEGLRPTPDRIRETLFNWLSTTVNDARCLDLFCGSGALGFEAASRGAQQVYLVDNNSKVAEQVKLNIKKIRAGNVTFKQLDVNEFLQQIGEPMDLVFLDPPFEKKLVEQTLQRLEKNNWLSADAQIYVETEKSLEQLSTPENWSLLKEKKAGQVYFRLYTNNKDNKNG